MYIKQLTQIYSPDSQNKAIMHFSGYFEYNISIQEKYADLTTREVDQWVAILDIYDLFAICIVYGDLELEEDNSRLYLLGGYQVKFAFDPIGTPISVQIRRTTHG